MVNAVPPSANNYDVSALEIGNSPLGASGNSNGTGNTDGTGSASSGSDNSNQLDFLLNVIANAGGTGVGASANDLSAAGDFLLTMLAGESSGGAVAATAYGEISKAMISAVSSAVQEFQAQQAGKSAEFKQYISDLQQQAAEQQQAQKDNSCAQDAGYAVLAASVLLDICTLGVSTPELAAVCAISITLTAVQAGMQYGGGDAMLGTQGAEIFNYCMMGASILAGGIGIVAARSAAKEGADEAITTGAGDATNDSKALTKETGKPVAPPAQPSDTTNLGDEIMANGDEMQTASSQERKQLEAAANAAKEKQAVEDAKAGGKEGAAGGKSGTVDVGAWLNSILRPKSDLANQLQLTKDGSALSAAQWFEKNVVNDVRIGVGLGIALAGAGAAQGTFTIEGAQAQRSADDFAANAVQDSGQAQFYDEMEQISTSFIKSMVNAQGDLWKTTLAITQSIGVAESVETKNL